MSSFAFGRKDLYLFTAVVHTELPKTKRMASHYSFLSDIIQNLAKIRSDTKEDRRSSMRRRGGVVDLEEDCQ